MSKNFTFEISTIEECIHLKKLHKAKGACKKGDDKYIS